MHFNLIFPAVVLVCAFLGFYLSYRHTYKANRIKAEEEKRDNNR